VNPHRIELISGRQRCCACGHIGRVERETHLCLRCIELKWEIDDRIALLRKRYDAALKRMPEIGVEALAARWKLLESFMTEREKLFLKQLRMNAIRRFEKPSLMLRIRKAIRSVAR
jgi:hypothetical protein